MVSGPVVDVVRTGGCPSADVGALDTPVGVNENAGVDDCGGGVSGGAIGSPAGEPVALEAAPIGGSECPLAIASGNSALVPVAEVSAAPQFVQRSAFAASCWPQTGHGMKCQRLL